MRRRLGSLLALVVALAPGPAHAQPPSDTGQRFERPIETAGPGAQKLAVDVPLLTAAQRFAAVRRDDEPTTRRRLWSAATGGLADLRLYDATGAEVPYLLVFPPATRPEWVSGAILPVVRTKAASGFEVDLGRSRLVDGLDIGGLPPPFLKRFLLEGSGDRARWTVLVGQGTLFDLPQERVRQVAMDFTPGEYRYLRVIWDDTSSAVLPLPARASVREAPAVPPPSGQSGVESPPLRTRVEIERQASEPGRSRHRIRLPAAGLPLVAVTLNVRSGDVFRTASVMESRFSGTRADPAELGRTRLVRMEGSGSSDTLRIPIEPPRGAEIQLVIEDGNNPPLAIETVSIEFANLPWIYFEAPAGGVTARYGDRAARAPQYDLEARRSAIRLDEVPEARWGEPRAVSERATSTTAPPATPERGAKLDLSGFRYRRALTETPQGLVSLPLDAAVLAHSRGQLGGFADVRLIDADGYQVPYLLERRDEPLSLDLSLRQVAADRETLKNRGTGNRSVYAATLPYPNLPAPRLVIETSDRVFRRPIEIAVERPPDRQHRDAWLDVLATRVWQHADQGNSAEPIDVPIQPGDATELLLMLDEGDNRPLAISSARLLLPAWRVRFFKAAAPLSLVYGHDSVAAPEYDLALLAPAVTGAEAREIAAAPEQPSGSAAAGQLSPKVFWIGVAAAALVLLALLVRLIASGTPPPPSPPAP